MVSFIYIFRRVDIWFCVYVHFALFGQGVSEKTSKFICVLFISKQFLLKVSKLLNQLEFILVPVANPDGYAVSEKGD